ncbi:hypothetical protein AWB71_02574 [Caballeronia peredens]|nr:hypothetical protein AWB71_02574 [Caballeronia peredens]
MSDICNNELTVSGRKEELKRFIAAHFFSKAMEPDATPADWSEIEKGYRVSVDLDCNTVIAMPVKNEPNQMSRDAFAFRVNEWGSKWGAFDGYLEFSASDDNGSICYNFGTAYDGIQSVIDRLEEKYPHLSFDYICLGTGYEDEDEDEESEKLLAD